MRLQVKDAPSVLYITHSGGRKDFIMKKTLGTRIAELRREKGLKQDELAEKLGVSSQAVSKWENDVSCPDIMLLPSLARELGVSVDMLLTGEGLDAPEVKYVPAEKRKKFDELMLRVKVNSADGDKVKVNLPLPLVKVFIEAGMSMDSFSIGNDSGKMSFSKLDIDWQKIILMAESGIIGTIVEVEGADGDTVEIVVE